MVTNSEKASRVKQCYGTTITMNFGKSQQINGAEKTNHELDETKTHTIQKLSSAESRGCQ